MKIFFCLFIFYFPLGNLHAENDKDWVLDLKTSTLIPKYVGTVKGIKGDVIVEDRNLQKGSKIYPRDVLKVQPKSFVKLELIDETQITVGPDSEFQVEQWAYRTKNDREALFNLMRGKMRAEIRSKSKEKDQLKIKSPLVSMGVRGTQFLLNYTTNKKSEVTQVALLEGKIHLNIDSLKEKLDLKPGDYIEVVKSATQNKSRKKVLPPEEFKVLNTKEAAEETNLLPDPLFEEESGELHSVNNLSNPDIQQNAEAPVSSLETSAINKKRADQSLKEKLKKLNQTREENLKTALPQW